MEGAADGVYVSKCWSSQLFAAAGVLQKYQVWFWEYILFEGQKVWSVLLHDWGLYLEYLMSLFKNSL